MSLGQRAGAATAVLVAALFLSVSEARSQDMNTDFTNITNWLSHEVSQGIGFNAGETFDPPREIIDRRLEPDISFGGGVMPLNKATFPTMTVAAIQQDHPETFFPSKVTFPNFTMHLRAGLPWRSDFAIRFADMTSPPGYKLSANATAQAQSNSIGATVRKHLFGGDWPMLSIGANFNHVYGRFEFQEKTTVDLSGFGTADAPITGGLYWNVNSYGLNAVLSQTFGLWTPFVGFGANYVTGSVRAHLQAVPQTDLIDPAFGDSSSKPDLRNGRAIVGLQLNHSWVNFFTSGEINTTGESRGKSWIVQSGMSLPFRIGAGGGEYARREKEQEEAYARLRRQRAEDRAEARAAAREASAPGNEWGESWTPRTQPSSRREMFGGPVKDQVEGTPTMIFIQ